jgi:hypothetical protein
MLPVSGQLNILEVHGFLIGLFFEPEGGGDMFL